MSAGLDSRLNTAGVTG